MFLLFYYLYEKIFTPEFWTYEQLGIPLLIFSMSFVSVFYAVQFSKYIHAQYISTSSSTSSSSSVLTKSKSKRIYPTILPLDDYVEMTLRTKEVLSHDTMKFTFTLPKDDHVLGLPIGQHVSLKYYHIDPNTQTKTAIQRSYTPVTDNTCIGYFSLVIKVYKPLLPKFPNGGLMSQHLYHMNINDTILVHGPKGHHEYIGNGKWIVKPLGKSIQYRTSSYHWGMMAGGTGITPMLQILHDVFYTNYNSKIQIHLIYANQTEQDILVRQELEDIQRQFPKQFTVWYTIDRISNDETTNTNTTTETWNYDIGFITPQMVQDHLLFPKHVKNPQFLLCGPPPMIKFACLPALQAAGYTESNWIIF